ncbi:MAG: hypothetical protein DRN21_04065, partial [Thermoplasmata archaeon]
MTNNAIINNDIGIRTTCASNPTINDNEIQGNVSYGIYNADGSVVINAEKNYWGDDSGPYHRTLNPEGLGDRVSDYVDFIPWIGRVFEADIVVRPSEVSVSSLPDSTGQEDLTIKNEGNADLVFAIEEEGGDIGWLSVAPDSGTVVSADSLVVTVQFDAAGLAKGGYDGNLRIRSNDATDSLITVPVHLTVLNQPPLVAIPDTWATPCDTLDIPVRVDDVTGLGIIGVGLRVTYDSDKVTGLSASTSGTIAEGWGPPTYNVTDGQINIAMAGATELSGSGPLVYIRFVVDPHLSPGASSPLHFADLDFNEGEVPASPQDGSVTVPLVHVSMPDTSGTPCHTYFIPVNVDDDVGGLNIISAGIKLTYDDSILEATGATTAGTIAEAAGWGPPTFGITPGQINIGMAGANALSGSGPLVYVEFHVDSTAQHGDSTAIHFLEMIFNETDPSAITTDGLFSIALEFDVLGNISYYADTTKAVNGAVVTALSGGVPVCFDTTDASGDYRLLNLPAGNYTVKPDKDVEGKESAVSPFDAAKVLQDYVGIIDFTPYQKIAGDVSGNGSISPFDAAKILQYYVGLIDSFAVGDWSFVPASFAVNDTNWALAPDSLVYEPLGSDQFDQDYVGLLYGDVSGNWSPGGMVARAIPAQGPTRRVSLGDVHGETGASFVLPVAVDDATDIISAGITLSYDPKVLRAVDVSTTNLTSGYSVAHNVADGRIKIGLAGSRPLWGSGPLLDVRFQVLESADWGETSPIAISDVQLNEGRIAGVARSATFTAPLPTGFALSQNYPNPSNPETNIAYQLPVSCEVRLAIYNLTGQLVKTLVSEKKKAGYHTAHWDGRDNLGK